MCTSTIELEVQSILDFADYSVQLLSDIPLDAQEARVVRSRLISGYTKNIPEKGRKARGFGSEIHALRNDPILQ